MEKSPVSTSDHGSSTGHALADAGWLDLHFEACRQEYEDTARSVGIQPGWRMLDAGTGSGSFLPVLADLVSPSGHLTALDLAPENIATVEARFSETPLACPLDMAVGSVLDMPYPDGHFDAVWCANMAQYLTEDEFMAMLREFRRVVRPGGLVAIKDFDATLTQHFPGDPGLLWRFCMARAKVQEMSRGVLRGRGFRRFLERAGFVDVRQDTILIERWAPLRPIEREFLTDLLYYWAEQAAEGGIPDEDQQFWSRFKDPESPDNPVNGPEFYWCEANALGVGTAPE